MSGPAGVALMSVTFFPAQAHQAAWCAGLAAAQGKKGCGSFPLSELNVRTHPRPGWMCHGWPVALCASRPWALVHKLGYSVEMNSEKLLFQFRTCLRFESDSLIEFEPTG
jgi:hypothetical protein